MINGSCLCGGVSFEISGELPPPNACHCSQCRKQSGYYWASTDIARTQLRLLGDESLAWFRSSARARRGFCRVCGSSLFWDPDGAETIAVSMGVLEAPTGTALERHIYVANKGDYYDIADGLPQDMTPPDG